MFLHRQSTSGLVARLAHLPPRQPDIQHESANGDGIGGPDIGTVTTHVEEFLHDAASPPASASRTQAPLRSRRNTSARARMSMMARKKNVYAAIMTSNGHAI